LERPCVPCPVRSTLAPGTVSGSRSALQGFPWSSAFPPATPPPVSRPVLFDAISGTTPMSDFPAACMAGLRPRAFPARSVASHGDHRDLPVLVHRMSAHAQGLRLRGAGRRLANWRRRPCGLPPDATGSAPRIIFYGAGCLACDSPCQRFAPSLRVVTHDSGPGWFAIPFLWGSCIPYPMPVYPGASASLNSRCEKPCSHLGLKLCVNVS